MEAAKTHVLEPLVIDVWVEKQTIITERDTRICNDYLVAYLIFYGSFFSSSSYPLSHWLKGTET